MDESSDTLLYDLKTIILLFIMPNDCWNHITMTFKNSEELNLLIENELKNNPTIKIVEQGKKGIIFKLTSDWRPDFKWFECLILKYPSSWIKNEWKEEGGQAGVWIGYVDDNNDKIIKEFEWRDLCVEEKYYFFENI